ncbi:hypothetical protein NQ176_g755 [Zarea fungicola]|uniref:Uncharacterized protein n=1 Tax=Zarea fungicola TaxID=93591 RepID=A0ACC1NXY5_9HYPO|nr:hypothetical protein NQ176_g755 [Lecanicillium fungicola]
MKAFWLWIGGAAAALAANRSASLSAKVSPPPGGVSLSRQDSHENIMKSHPAEWIVNSTTLSHYFKENYGTNHTIYLSDEEAFVHRAAVRSNSPPLAKRLLDGPNCNAPYYYTKTWAKQVQQFPGSWSPASPCLGTYHSDSGGSEGIWSAYSISVTQQAGLDWTLIANILSASMGISVTTTRSETKTYNCNVKKHSVVQVWVQPYIAWGWFWSQHCVQRQAGCGASTCGSEYVDGGATAPAKNPNTGQWLNYGCSTGSKNVKC